ncbi:hypothetical protein [Xanthomonas campestris]|uniref:hypothetical protein n=1 Tax=Xanthomonas campestris TaxID=339 RepID=UPI000E32608F|nr:hypothetical protein [Xanthomonas campestris]RFF46165.1 hypothetical protein D0A35_18685 [Xanthomonas campestris]
MKALLLVIVAATLTSCASYSERQAQAPWFTLESDLSVVQQEQCLAPKLREISPRITGAPDGDAKVYTVVADPAVLGTITIRPLATGSITEIRSVIKGGKFKEARLAVEGCKGRPILLR